MNNINEDAINDIIKKKIERGEPIDIHKIGIENEEQSDDDEIGLYDHVYDSSMDSQEDVTKPKNFIANKKALKNKSSK